MQIASVILNNTMSGTDGLTLVPEFARKDEAQWNDGTLPEVGRQVLRYTKRPPVKGTELVKHTFRVTLPALKSVVTDPEGPYTPPPALDYVSVAEVSVWVHPRATAAQREAAVASVAVLNTSFVDVMNDVVKNGNSLY